MDGERHTIEVETDGSRPTVTKSARGEAAARLRVEAAMLAAARHPGVVTLVDGRASTDDAGTVRVRTRFVGSRTLATLGPVEPARAAGLVAALATTVADLHDLGITHGRITADHVIVATDGRPVLCGFAEAGSASTGRHRPADDVAALGRLLHDLVAPSPDPVEEPPPRRLLYRRPTGAQHRGALLNLADQATADDPLRRPTARQLAAAIGATVPNATLHTEPAEPPGPTHTAVASSPGRPGRRSEDLHPLGAGLSDPPPSLRRPGILVVGAIGVVAVVALAMSAVSGDSSATTTATPTTTTTPTSATSSSTSTPLAVAAASAPTTAPHELAALGAAAGCASVADGSTAATADGAPCPAAMSVSGRTLVVAGTAFDLGIDRAAVALGDFACDGHVRPAVVDLAAGHIFVFDEWARAARPVDTTAIVRIDAPRQVIAEPIGEGCHRLVVLDTWGIRHVIEVAIDPPEEPAP